MFCCPLTSSYCLSLLLFGFMLIRHDAITVAIVQWSVFVFFKLQIGASSHRLKPCQAYQDVQAAYGRPTNASKLVP
jgi:hypothetical protein